MRIPHVREIYLDEAEGFLLEHALVSPPRTWPPLPTTQSDRLTQNRKKMDWQGEARAHPDEPVVIPTRSDDGHGDSNKERCVICLMALRDRTIVGVCGHEFCFECIGVWANQSRRCPLCSAEMAPFLLHDLDAAIPTKFYLPPLPQRSLPSASTSQQASGSRRPYNDAQREREKVEMDELDLQVARRKEIYQNELFVKHIGSNPITKFIPNPTPRQIADDPQLSQRATMFLRRELRVWSLVDVEYLTTYIMSFLKAVDIRSEPAIRLLGEFLNTTELPRGAEQFAHELYTWLRSPYKDLRKYDEVVQYDDIPSQSRPCSPSSSRSRSPSRSISRSPSRSISSLSSYSSRSRSRSRSRIRSPSPPRIPGRRDTYIPSVSAGRRWNEPDVWIDPEYEKWMDDERRRREERLDRKRRRPLLDRVDYDDRSLRGEGRPMREWGKKVELLPSPPPATLRMDDSIEPTITPSGSVMEDRQARAAAKLLSIKGAAKDLGHLTSTVSVRPVDPDADAKRQKLLDRLAKAKSESMVKTPPLTDSTAQPRLPVQAPAQGPEDEGEVEVVKGRGLSRQRARIQLKLKLESEKKTFRHSLNFSKAQELRQRLLDSKARREAEETDASLRRLDIIDRRRELRRRLMVVKMMAAETAQERRARELRERLMARRLTSGVQFSAPGVAVDVA